MRVLALTSLKGGTGKTTIAASLAHLAGEKGRPVVVIDLDAHAPLTASVLGGPSESVSCALGSAAAGDDCMPHLVSAPVLGPDVWLLGGGRGESPLPLLQYLPALCEQIAATPIGGRLPGWAILDCPGYSDEVTQAVLSAATDVVVPMSLTMNDVATTIHTLVMIKRTGGSGAHFRFLGLIPNNVVSAMVDRSVLGAGDPHNPIWQAVSSGKLLPHIPNSNTVRATFARTAAGGAVVPVAFAAHTPAAAQLRRLFEAIDTLSFEREQWAFDLMVHVGYSQAEARRFLSNGHS
jgi:MinD-like ATPase involved in chromosome partitioning or flagellar assembly